jgi:hypothetical protein
MGVLNKIWWIALTAIITGIIGSTLFMLGGTAG